MGSTRQLVPTTTATGAVTMMTTMMATVLTTSGTRSSADGGGDPARDQGKRLTMMTMTTAPVPTMIGRTVTTTNPGTDRIGSWRPGARLGETLWRAWLIPCLMLS